MVLACNENSNRDTIITHPAPIDLINKKEFKIIELANSNSNAAVECSKGRYDCFVGYKNRLDFAIEKELSCVDECRCQAVSTALSTMTAFYANNENTSSKRFMDVVDFIRYNSLKVQNKLKFKERILLWSFNNCTYLHRIYAILSGLSKKIG